MNTQATMMSTAQPSLPRLQNRWRTLAEQVSHAEREVTANQANCCISNVETEAGMQAGAS